MVGYYPSLVNNLPNRASFTSETAPSPRNPELQTFDILIKHHRDALLDYRRAVDKGYVLVASSLEFLNGTESLRAMKDHLDGLWARVESAPPAHLVDAVTDLSKQIKTVPGTGDVTSSVSET